MMDDLLAQLRRDEGVKRTMYRDSLGFPTIGVGHNLDVPLSDAAIDQILRDDVATAEAGVNEHLPWAKNLSPARRGVILNMAFNLGIDGLLGFRRFLRYAEAGEWIFAADEMLRSRWAGQVGERAVRLSQQVLTDEWR